MKTSNPPGLKWYLTGTIEIGEESIKIKGFPPTGQIYTREEIHLIRLRRYWGWIPWIPVFHFLLRDGKESPYRFTAPWRPVVRALERLDWPVDYSKWAAHS